MLVANFLLAMITAVLIGYVARWLASHLVSENVAPIAAFAFLLGVAGARAEIGSGSPPEEIARAIGTMAGAALIWWLFFKRKQPDSTEER